MERKLEAQEVEPNSNLGEALRYELKHWEPLTLFLRVPAAPLDNNLCYAARGIREVMPTPGLCRVACATDDFTVVFAAFGVDDAA